MHRTRSRHGDRRDRGKKRGEHAGVARDGLDRSLQPESSHRVPAEELWVPSTDKTQANKQTNKMAPSLNTQFWSFPKFLYGRNLIGVGKNCRINDAMNPKRIKHPMRIPCRQL